MACTKGVQIRGGRGPVRPLDSPLRCDAEPVGVAPIVPFVVVRGLALPAVAVIGVVVVPVSIHADYRHYIFKLRPTTRAGKTHKVNMCSSPRLWVSSLTDESSDIFMHDSHHTSEPLARFALVQI